MITFKPFMIAMTAAALMAVATTSSSADESVLPTSSDMVETYWSAKFWTVFKNTSRQSCFIEWRSENSVVQAGLTGAQDAAYLGAFVRDFEPADGMRDITIELNGNVYVGSANTVSRSLAGGFGGGYIVFDNPKFLSDLEEAREFVAYPDTPNRFTVKLKTPRNAIDRARACMEEL